MKTLVFTTHFLYFVVWISFPNFVHSVIHKGINKHKPHIEKEYAGTILEHSKKVQLKPFLFAVDKDAPQHSGLICEYRLHAVGETNSRNIPFYVSILNQNTGEAELWLKPDYELSACGNKTEYDFLITAHDCGTGINKNGRIIRQRSSHKSKVHISVVEVNKFDPYFPKQNFQLEMEGEIAAEQLLLSLEAVDEDCSHKYGAICGYEIDNMAKESFKISSQGLLLTEKNILAEENPIKFNISVVAFDCSHRKSDPALVHITVNPTCAIGWSGVKENVNFVSVLTSAVKVASNPGLDVCVPLHDISGVDVIVSLDMSRVKFITGCDRDAYVTKDEKRTCNSVEQSIIELLPTSLGFAELKIIQNTEPLQFPVLKEENSNHEIRFFDFNGVDEAFKINDRNLLSNLNNLNISSSFSISFRMLLKTNDSESQRKRKYTIICKSDQSGLSRHHLSVYVSNCHLMLLRRLEHGHKGKLSSSEWHWKLNHNKKCADTWYRVLLRVSGPNASLSINGEERTPFIIADDFPLHPSSAPSAWVIGAAWEGQTSQLVQHFHGQLSDLVVYVGELKDPDVLQCVRHCKEGFATISHSDDAVDSTPVSDIRLKLSSDGSDITSLVNKLKNVFYVNHRRVPISGQRRIKMETKIKCISSADNCPVIPPLYSYVTVMSPQNFHLSITGAEHITKTARNVKSQSLYPFEGISIKSMTQNISTSDHLFYSENLDKCVIKESGNPHKGRFKVRPNNLLQRFNLDVQTNEIETSIRGTQSLSAYEELLRATTYRNHRPFQAHDITFAITCSKLNGRFHSNEYKLKVSIVADKMPPHVVETISEPKLSVEAVEPHVTPAGMLALAARPNDVERLDVLTKSLLISSKGKDQSSNRNVPGIVAGTCVGLMLLIVIIIFAHTKTQGCPAEQFDEEEDQITIKDQLNEVEEGEMDWDDSAMTITVNPMDEALDNASELDFSEIDEDVSDIDDSVRSCDRESENHGAREDDSYEWEN